MSTQIRIIQQSGAVRGIVLQGASMPEKGTVSFPGDQRTNIEWMAGSRVAVSQVLGATEETIPMAGFWHDSMVYADDSAPVLLNFPTISPSARPGTDSQRGQIGGPVFTGSTPQPQQRARTAIAIWGALDLMRAEGVICKFEWGHIVRYGFLGMFTPTPDRMTDIAWEAEFRVTGLTLSQPKPVLKTLTLPGLLRQLLDAIDRILNQIATIRQKVATSILTASAAIDRVVSLLLGLTDLLREAADLANTPFDLLQRIRGSLQSVVLGVKDVAFAGVQLGRTAREAVTVKVSASGDPAEVTDVVLDDMELLDLLLEAGVEAATRSAELEQLESSQLLDQIVATAGTTLQSLAMRYYGDGRRWETIRDFNGLVSSRVASGTVIAIPRI